MNKRLEQFLAAENISQAKFADEINVTRASVSHILAGRNNPSYDFLLETMRHYPALNIEWLLDGKGKMYKVGIRDEATAMEPTTKAEDMQSAQTAAAQNNDPDANNGLLPFPDTLTINEDVKTEPIDKQSTMNVSRSRRIVKVMVMYDDGTFEELG